jgi:hypothetical protein
VISFWVDQPGRFTIDNYLLSRGAAIADRFSVRVYEYLGTNLALPRGPHVFSAVDQLTPSQREAAGAMADQLAASDPSVRVLNHPARVLLRPDLLRALARQDLNDYAVHRADRSETVTRFPVFVREAHRHTGSATGLIHSPRDLQHALAALRLRGYRIHDLLVVEYCDTADAGGIYRKYAAIRVGDAIVPAHMMAGTQWMVKSSGDTPTVELAKESLWYVDENPHADWLQRVFAIAGADYGRIDYGVRNGRPQAWEINLNPTVGRPPGKPPRVVPPEVARYRDLARERFHERLRSAFVALDQSSEESTVTVRLDPHLLRRITTETARAGRRRSALAMLQRLYENPWLGRPFRSIYSKLFARV